MSDKTAIEKAKEDYQALVDYVETGMILPPEDDPYWRASSALDSLGGFLAAIEAEKPAEDAEITRAFSMLELYGVPRGRAKTVSNGIDVLATRYRKDRNGFDSEKQSYAESYHAEQCKACKK